ncbi:hypothetical protein SESBI_10647 [Sesbania bispinosa]|nr:hypothetical protein SESBI_10647 [Sesbania bispinosa]
MVVWPHSSGTMEKGGRWFTDVLDGGGGARRRGRVRRCEREQAACNDSGTGMNGGDLVLAACKGRDVVAPPRREGRSRRPPLLLRIFVVVVGGGRRLPGREKGIWVRNRGEEGSQGSHIAKTEGVESRDIRGRGFYLSVIKIMNILSLHKVLSNQAQEICSYNFSSSNCFKSAAVVPSGKPFVCGIL